MPLEGKLIMPKTGGPCHLAAQEVAACISRLVTVVARDGQLLDPEERGRHNGGSEDQENAEQHVSLPLWAGAVRVDVYVGHYGRTFTGAGFFAAPRLRRSSRYRAVNGMNRLPISTHSAMT